MTTRRVARAENGKPHLQLVASDGQPRLQRSAAERIAEQTGGAIETGEGGLRTVHFPAPGGAAPLPFTQQPYTISRELTEGGTSPAPHDRIRGARAGPGRLARPTRPPSARRCTSTSSTASSATCWPSASSPAT